MTWLEYVSARCERWGEGKEKASLNSGRGKEGSCRRVCEVV